VGAQFFIAIGATALTIVSIIASILILFIIALIAIPTGYVQRLIVRVLIGLDYDEENIQKATYSCNIDLETLMQKVLDDSFLKTLRFVAILNESDMKIYKWTLKSGIIASTSIILTITPDIRENHSNRSVLAFVAYRRTFDYLFGLEEDKKLIDNIYEIINNKLFEVNADYGLTEDKNEKFASNLAKTYAEYQTKSIFRIVKEPVVGVWHTSHYYFYAIATTLAIIWGLTLADAANFASVGSNTYLNLIILAILVLVAEIGVPLRDELSRRRERQDKRDKTQSLNTKYSL
jgi:hypothetical protein